MNGRYSSRRRLDCGVCTGILVKPARIELTRQPKEVLDSLAFLYSWQLQLQALQAVGN